MAPGVLESTALRCFHLDQYGWPKFARRSDGARVDLAESYRVLLDAVRERMPTARFMFNNVNDFPTGLTAQAPQDALYVEPWAPQLTLQSLGGTRRRAVLRFTLGWTHVPLGRSLPRGRGGTECLLAGLARDNTVGNGHAA